MIIVPDVPWHISTTFSFTNSSYVIDAFPATPLHIVITGQVPTVVVQSIVTATGPEAIVTHVAAPIPVVMATPHLNITMDNPVYVAFDLQASIQLSAPTFNPQDVEGITHLLRLDTSQALTFPEPTITRGQPVLPRYVARPASDMVLITGPDHIHSIPDPNPKWNWETDGWSSPPAFSPGDYRWTCQDLPDPGGSYYWLGTPSAHDSTSGITAAARQWSPDGSTPGAPTFYSIFPYKPSVWNHVAYGSGGKTTTTKGVRFNLQYVEHMWADFGGLVPVGFTVIMVALVMDYPSPGYVHTLLDVGRNPMDSGVPDLSVSQLNRAWTTNDQVDGGARPRMMIGPGVHGISSDTGLGTLQCGESGAGRPRMYYGVYNGGGSRVGNMSTDGHLYTVGSFGEQGMRHILLGRAANIVNRPNASHFVLFEMRIFRHALSVTELKQQYADLSSTFRFSQYG